MTRIRPSLVLAMALGAAIMPTRAACKLTSLDLPVTMKGLRPVTTLGINGSNVPLMVDSGAFHSVLTFAAAKQLGLQVGPLPYGLRIEGFSGEVDAGLARVHRLRLPLGEIPDAEFLVGGNGEFSGTLGFLGRNILAAADAEYDLANGVIRLMFPNDDCRGQNMAYWAGEQPVSELPLLRDEGRPKRPAIRTMAQINGQRLRVLLDTGATSVLSLRMARQAGITNLKPAGKAYGAGRGELEQWNATVERFTIGLETISNFELDVADYARDRSHNHDMLLGVDFFLSHRIYVSNQQRRLYFTHNGGPVFAHSLGESASRSAGETTTETTEDTVDAAALTRRAAAAAARHDFTKALNDLDRACALEPQVAEHFIRRATVQIMRKQAQLALADLDRALALEPGHAEALLHRAELHLSLRQREAALTDMQTLDASLPTPSHQRLALANWYTRLEIPELALRQWTMWIEAHPHDRKLANALNGRCWTRNQLGIELDQAMEDCNRAIELNAENASFHDSRAWLRLRRGELQEALLDYERALQLHPQLAWSLYGRGLVRQRLGEAAGGQADLEAARRLEPRIDEQASRHSLSALPG